MREVRLSEAALAEVRRRAFPMPFSVTSERAGFLYFVTSRPAMSMSKEQRERAATDDALEYDPVRHGYRRKRGPSASRNPALL